MSINHTEILGMLESHDRNRELSAVIQSRQDQIKYIMEQENLSQTKDLITIVQNFKGLTNLNENELKTKYNVLKFEELKRTYPDFKFKLEDGDIHASLARYEGDTLPEFPPGLKKFYILGCKNLEALPEFPSGLERLEIYNCENLEALPEFPPGLESLGINNCPNLGSIPEFPPGLKDLTIWKCHNLTQETLDRIKEFKKK